MSTHDDDDLPALPKIQRRAGALLNADQRQIAEKAVELAETPPVQNLGMVGHCSHGSHGSW